MDAKLAALLNDKELWDAQRIATELKVTVGAVKKWRSNGLRDEREGRTPGNGSLPPSDVDGHALWYAGTIRRWAMQTGRMDKNGTPKKATSPGRPRGSRNKKTAA